MAERTKMVIAVGVLVVGVGVILRGMRTVKPEPIASKMRPTSELVKRELDPERLESVVDQPGGETLLGKIHARVLELALDETGIRDMVQSTDLADVLCEQLRSLWNPDFDRDYAASHRRFDPRSHSRALEFFNQVSPLEVGMPNGRVSLERLSVRLPDPQSEGAYQRSLLDAGFSVLVGKRPEGETYPLPIANPIAHGALVAEITLPMMRRDMVSNSMRTAVVGFRFVYHPEKKCWMPYESVVLATPDDAFTMVPF